MKIKFSNLQSRMFLRSLFERQFIVPEPPPKLLEDFLKRHEQHVLNVDISHIPLDRPIFLIGVPRSGTSMVQDIICAHPNVAYITNTMHQFRRCFCAAEDFRKRLNLNVKGERYLGDSVEVDAGSPADAVAFWGEWLGEDPSSLEYVERRIEHFSKEQIEQIRQTIRKMIWCFGQTANRFFSKNLVILPNILLLKDLFPDAKIIHIVRDARMCANSLLKLYRLNQEQLTKIRAHGPRHDIYDEKPFVPYPRLPKLANYAREYGLEDIRTTANLWNDAVSLINEKRNNLPFFYEVRYEDILANPREEIFKILNFCELGDIKEDNNGFRKKLSNVGVIRHTSKYGDFEVVEEICRDNMQKYGYL